MVTQFANNGLEAIVLGSNSDNNVFVHGNKFIGASELETMGIPVEVMSGNVSYANPPTKEMSAKVFGSIFDILNLSFVDYGNSTSQTVYPDIHEEEKGKSKAWVDIVGWNNLTQRNGVFFIPAGEQPIVKYGAENTAGRPISTDTSLALTEDNRTLTADLEVTAVYEVAKRSTKAVNGLLLPSMAFTRKFQVSHYYDNESIPETYNASINATAYVTILNNSRAPQTRIVVPASPDVMKVLYEYNGTQTVRYLHTGITNTTAKGVKYAQISDLNYWNGTNVTRMGDTLVIPNAIDPQKVKSLVKITQFDFYGNEVPITDYQIEVKNQDEKKLINPFSILLSGIVGIFAIGIFKIAGVVL